MSLSCVPKHFLMAGNNIQSQVKAHLRTSRCMFRKHDDCSATSRLLDEGIGVFNSTAVWQVGSLQIVQRGRVKAHGAAISE